MQRSAAWRTAIILFLPDDLVVHISDRLKIANEKCRPISDEELEAMAYQAEEAYRKPPSWPLKYGRNIGSMPVSAMIQFNSMQIANAIIPTCSYPSGYEQFSLPPNAGNNPTVEWQEATWLQQQRTALQEATRLQQQRTAQQKAFQQQQQRTAQQKATQMQEQSVH